MRLDQQQLDVVNVAAFIIIWFLLNITINSQNNGILAKVISSELQYDQRNTAHKNTSYPAGNHNVTVSKNVLYPAHNHLLTTSIDD